MKTMKNNILYILCSLNLIIAIFLLLQFNEHVKEAPDYTLSKQEKLFLLDTLVSINSSEETRLIDTTKLILVLSAEYFYTFEELYITVHPNDNEKKYYFVNGLGTNSYDSYVHVLGHFPYAENVLGLRYEILREKRVLYKGILLFTVNDSIKIIGNAIGA